MDFTANLAGRKSVLGAFALGRPGTPGEVAELV
jgi:hypothetical protein